MVMKKMRRTVITTAMAAMLLCGTCSAFAAPIANVDGADNASTPAHLNMPATKIAFTITEKINMTGNSNSNDLTVDDLTISNTMAVGTLSVDSIKAQAVSGWSMDEFSAAWADKNVNTKEFGLQADSTHDMVGEYTAAGTILHGETDTTTFAGKTAAVNTEISDEKVADIIVTVSQVEAE